jgi:hypothetical protein
MLVLMEPIEAGKVTPVIDRTHPMSEVPKAVRYLEEGIPWGKVQPDYAMGRVASFLGTDGVGNRVSTRSRPKDRRPISSMAAT